MITGLSGQFSSSMRRLTVAMRGVAACLAEEPIHGHLAGALKPQGRTWSHRFLMCRGTLRADMKEAAICSYPPWRKVSGESTRYLSDKPRHPFRYADRCYWVATKENEFMISEPLQLALHNDFQVVALGLKTMLEPFEDQVVLREVATQMPVEGPVDLTLFDTFGSVRSENKDIDQILASDTAGKVVVYSWNMHPKLIDDALSKGCSGYVSKGLDGKELVEVLERIIAGEIVVSSDTENHDGSTATAENTEVTWPGKDEGLSPRESEILAMIVQGHTNQDIADCCYLSINSVKRYIRTAYRKMGVERRSQAVRWGMENGMLPVRDRVKFY